MKSNHEAQVAKLLKATALMKKNMEDAAKAAREKHVA